MLKKIFFGLVIVVIAGLILYRNQTKQMMGKLLQTESKKTEPLYPLSIEAMRQKNYPGSDIVIEETLEPGENYSQYLVSYKSDGLKIFALLTVPNDNKPKNGFSVIIFNHGYIQPEQYQTTERYVAYVDVFARNGFIVLKPDYRGHGNSEGKPEGAYYSPAYTTDVLNAVSSIKKFKDVDSNKIGMWGHSMGGNITLRAMIVSKDIKAGVIWSGVVGTYEELLTKWTRVKPWQPSPREAAGHVTSIRQHLQQTYGTPDTNPDFWHSIDPRYYLKDISGPVQLHQGLEDEEVPALFSESLTNDLKKAGKTVELYEYPGADHNISEPSFSEAINRSIEFFNKYLKTDES